MSDIPLARELVAKVRGKLVASHPGEADTLTHALSLMTRSSPARARAPSKSAPVSSETAKAIRELAHNQPHLSYQDIAESFGVNIGRVSEAMHYER